MTKFATDRPRSWSMESADAACRSEVVPSARQLGTQAVEDEAEQPLALAGVGGGTLRCDVDRVYQPDHVPGVGVRAHLAGLLRALDQDLRGVPDHLAADRQQVGILADRGQ